MKIVVASDHRGYEVKRLLIPYLIDRGHLVADVGCDGPASCDYPDFAAPAARAVAAGEAEIGVLLDNSGLGMSIVANKIAGVRAALVLDEVAAKLAREANHANALCLACDLLGAQHLFKIVDVFLSTEPGAGRHERRVRKIAQIEALERPALRSA
jgi:ribose 5-phosphate isomerase B